MIICMLQSASMSAVSLLAGDANQPNHTRKVFATFRRDVLFSVAIVL